MTVAASLVQALPYVAILIALATFIASQRETSRRAKVDYVAGLEKRIEECERDRERMHRTNEEHGKQIAKLKDDNFELMSKLLDRERGP